MTKEQAIKLLRKETSPMEIHILEIEGLDYDEVTNKIQEAMDMGADAIEKQIGKKIERYDSNIIGEMTFNCPSCNLEYYVTDYEDFNYCPNCGQKIDWSEVDENKEDN